MPITCYVLLIVCPSTTFILCIVIKLYTTDDIRYINTFCFAVSTQIEIVIQRYLRKLRKKSSVKQVRIDRNSTLNIETFQLGLIAVLFGPCRFSDLV